MRFKDYLIMQKEQYFCPDPQESEELKRLKQENRTLRKQLNFYITAYFSLQEKLYKSKLRG